MILLFLNLILLARGRFAFYVNDEPEIHPFPRWEARDIARVLADRHPGTATANGAMPAGRGCRPLPR